MMEQVSLLKPYFFLKTLLHAKRAPAFTNLKLVRGNLCQCSDGPVSAMDGGYTDANLAAQEDKAKLRFLRA